MHSNTLCAAFAIAQAGKLPKEFARSTADCHHCNLNEVIVVYERGLHMRTFLVAIVFVLAVLSVTSASAQSIDETADSLETAISDLHSALDDLEDYRGSAADDLSAAMRSVRNARRTMHSTAISLLISSMDPRRPKESQRTVDALRILAPKLFDKPKPPVRTP